MIEGLKPKEATTPRGEALLHDPSRNKGTAFTDEERDRLGLRGLLPPRVNSQDEQVRRVLENYTAKPNDLEKFVYLTALHDRNETLFYRVVMDHLPEMMPIIYTPTVGEACQKYGHIFRRARGLFISIHDRGRVADVLRNWPVTDVRLIVVTDGERILGLGDLGASGMGIPIGKLALYTACAGVPPACGLPVMLDVGTNNQSLLEDPLYLGIGEKRLRGSAYDDLLEEFVEAVQEVFPGCLIQFEDFANFNAFRLLATYRDRVCAFNDDIQGTAAVALAGLYSAGRITGHGLADQKLLFAGAGAAATGIADIVVAAMMQEGISREDAITRCWFVDSKGLVVRSRDDLAEHKIPYAHEHEACADLATSVRALRPTAIVGASGQPGIFDRTVVSEVAAANERPIIFALSNPTSRAECTATDAYRWTDGRAVFASGSPFDPVTVGDRTLVPGQGNNAYIFPGVGLGVVLSGATRVTDEMFFVAARTLAAAVAPEDLARGTVYPPLVRIRNVSASIATAVAEVAWHRGLAAVPRSDDPRAWIESLMFQPTYGPC
jgi:malate dehydrogenase (oxaloacetate-decarboxylating)(NADP+)